MAYEMNNSTGAAPARARSEEPTSAPHGALGGPPPPPPPSDLAPTGRASVGPPIAPRLRAELPEDLRVAWGWLDVALFVILGLVAGVIVTWGIGLIAVRLFGLKPSDVFGSAMTTPKSLVLLVSQALWDGGAVMFLYVMLLVQASAPFWRSMGWREMRPGTGTIRDSALQYLVGGAVLAIVISFAGGFLNPKETLPIEELLKARVSAIVFGILAALVAPVVEETIFRGFLYPVVARQFGVGAGVTITGTLFGLLHAAQLWGGWWQIALLILVGIVLTWVRARTGTVAASYFVHLGYNGLPLVGYLIYVIGGGRH